MVGDPGVEPGLPCSQSRRVTVSLASGGEVRNRTGSPTLARRGRCLTCHPRSGPPRDRTGNLRPAGAALCQLELAAHSGAAPGTGLSPGVAGLSFAAPHQCRGRMAPAADAHAMDMSKSKHVHPRAVLCRGGRTRTPDAQFWRLPFWPLNYAPMADPYKRRTARRKSPRAVPGDQNSALPGNLRDAQGKRRARLAVPTV